MKQFIAETNYLLLTKKTLLNKRVLCSFSGGQDSTIVFFSLFHRKRLNQTINIVYFHHFWQIQNFQASKGIFHLSFNLKISYSIILSTHSLSNENRSRNWRKKNLYRFSNSQWTSTIVTGHTQTDSLETNLNNIIRGTSSKGVSFRNCFGANRQEKFYSYQNAPGYCFYPLVFSTSFVVLKFLSQPKTLSYVKKIRLRSKIFFAKVNSFSEKCLLPVLQRKFVRKNNPATEKLQSFQHSKLMVGSTAFKAKGLSKTKNFSKEICRKKKLISGLHFQWRDSSKNILLETPFYPNFFKVRIKRHFWDIQSLEIQGKFRNLWFCKQEEFPVSENLKKNKFFYHCLHNSRSITNSNSFYFLKFSEQRTIKQKIPLKNQTRITVSKVAKIYNLPIFHDLTNFSYQSSRNKIRHIVFPLIGSIFQKKVDCSFTQFFSILITETWESETVSEKISFLIDFFCLPSADYSNLARNCKKNETYTFKKFLLIYICEKSQLNFQVYLIKKIIRDYTERELSFNQILNIQKILSQN